MLQVEKETDLDSNSKHKFYHHHGCVYTHIFKFCLAFSMSFLISGVMLKRNFLGMGKGIIGDLINSVFFLPKNKNEDDSGFKRAAGQLQSLVLYNNKNIYKERLSSTLLPAG